MRFDGVRSKRFSTSFSSVMFEDISPQDTIERLTALKSKLDTKEGVRARNRFYGCLIDIAGNADLKRILPVMQVHLLRIQFPPRERQSAAARLRDYRRIADAVLAGNQVAAKSDAGRHASNLGVDLRARMATTER